MDEKNQLIAFINRAVSPYHTVLEVMRRLKESGFSELKLSEEWSVSPGGKYYVNFQDSSLIAFRYGTKFEFKETFRIAAAHTDFPCLRLKPSPDMAEEGYGKVNVEVYGGMTLNTWLDRPLSVAGKVVLKSNQVFKPEIKFVDIKKPVFIIPNIAIHLNKDINKGQELNKQTDMLPIAGMIKKEADKNCYFMRYLADYLQVNLKDILDYDLILYNCEEGKIVGIEEDFIASPRLDNMTSVLALCKGIIHSEMEKGMQAIALFDHEEIGSKTKQGAGSLLLTNVLEKAFLSFGFNHMNYIEAIADSMLLSVDVSHGYHPNQGGKYDPTNKAVLNSGVTIKEAAGQSYATDCEAVAIIQQLCMLHQIPYKKFVNRSDGTSGSTLGSIASSMLPLKTVDLGVPLLAMHSAMELMGAQDQKSLEDLLKVYFSEN